MDNQEDLKTQEIDNLSRIKTWTNAKGDIQAEVKIIAEKMETTEDIDKIIVMHSHAWKRLKETFPNALILKE